MPEVGPMKKFKDKKSMWAAIAGELSSETGLERTAMQCENRFKTVKKKHNNARKHNRQSGVSPVDIPYAEQMDKLAAVEYALYPEVLRGVWRVERNTPATSQASAADHAAGAATATEGSDVACPAAKRPKTSKSHG